MPPRVYHATVDYLTVGGGRSRYYHVRAGPAKLSRNGLLAILRSVSRIWTWIFDPVLFMAQPTHSARTFVLFHVKKRWPI